MVIATGIVSGDAAVDKQELFPNPIRGSAVWSAGGVSEHCTSSGEFVYNRRRPRPDEASLVDVCGGQLTVEWIGMLDLVVHCSEDVHVTLNDVSVVPGFAFENAMSVTRMADTHPVIMNPGGISTLNGRLHFVRGATGSYVQATRVPHGAAPSADAATLVPQ